MGEGGRKKPGPRSDINKLAIRRDYAQGGTNISELARKYGVNRDTISRWIKAEGWAAPKEVARRVTAEIQQQVVASAASEIAPHVSQYLISHAEASELAMQWAVQMLKDGLAGKIQPGGRGEQTMADVFRSVVDGLKTVVGTSRAVAGLTDGQPSVKTEGDEEERRVDQAVLVVRPKEQTA